MWLSIEVGANALSFSLRVPWLACHTPTDISSDARIYWRQSENVRRSGRLLRDIARRLSDKKRHPYDIQCGTIARRYSDAVQPLIFRNALSNARELLKPTAKAILVIAVS